MAPAPIIAGAFSCRHKPRPSFRSCGVNTLQEPPKRGCSRLNQTAKPFGVAESKLNKYILEYNSPAPFPTTPMPLPTILPPF